MSDNLAKVAIVVMMSAVWISSIVSFTFLVYAKNYAHGMVVFIITSAIVVFLMPSILIRSDK